MRPARFIVTLVLGAWSWTARAAEVIPPVPRQWFNDYAGVVSPATATRLNKTLEDFERETSNQILVVIYPKMQSASSIEDYTVRVAQAWKVGQKGRNNGAVLFVFIQDRQMFLQVGYGLEGALPDALCKRIIEDEIKPRFRNNDFDGGLSAGVRAILAATRGEYKGTGHTAGRPAPSVLERWIFNRFFPWNLFLLFVLLTFLMLVGRALHTVGLVYGPWGRRARRRMTWHEGWRKTADFWGAGGSGGGWSGGSRSGGWSGGGGFSAGGGSFGGGGAGGRW